MSNGATTPRATRSTPAPDEWLPLVRQGTIASKTLWSDIELQARHNWFMAFAAAMGDTVQGRMLAKFYLFLRDFVPQGLTGRFSHVSGRDVMAHLLSHPGQSAPSRHRVTKSAEAAFRDLDRWVGKETSWQAALARAKATTEGDKSKLGRKRPAYGKAPGLHSPGELLAVLIISHPDPEFRFRNWIGTLQIDWMVQSRDALDVRHGFWRGLNSGNLGDIFAIESEERSNEAEMLADYDCLFGEKFIDCQKDIRPHIPKHWADRLSPLQGKASDHDGLDGSDGGSDEDGIISVAAPAGGRNSVPIQDDLPNVTTEEARHLRSRLNKKGGDPRDLEDWLVGELQNQGEDSVLTAWCIHWEDKIDQVDDLEGQMITRALFLQSLQRLKSLQAGPQSLATAWMILDMAELGVSLPESSSDTSRGHVPLFVACRDAATRLVSQVERTSPSEAVQDLMHNIISRQYAFFCEFMQYNTFFLHWTSVLTFAALYLHVISQGVDDPVMSRDRISYLMDKRNSILEEKMIKTLRLRDWQIQALLLPGSEIEILTDWQDSALRRRFSPELTNGSKAVEPSHLKPMPVTRGSAYPEAIEKDHGSLYKLFGTVEHPSMEPEPALGALLLGVSGPGTVPPSKTPSMPTPSTAATVPRSPSIMSSNIAPGNNPASTSARSSRYSGKTFNVAKRSTSPLGSGGSGGRPLKLARLESAVDRTSLVESVRELKAELKTQLTTDLKAQLTADLKTQLTADLKTQLTAELKTQLAAELKAQLATELKTQYTAELAVSLAQFRQSFPTHEILRETCQAEVNTVTETLKRYVQEKGSTCRDDTQVQAIIQPRLEEIRDDFNTSLHTQREALLSSIANIAQDHTARSLKRLKVHLTVQDDVEQADLELRHKALLEPGRDGYLSQCRATPSWTHSQQEYEAQLMHAAWRYIHSLGAPYGGVGEDEEAWTSVVEEYPCLDEDHLEMALNHAHVTAYGRMFREKEEV